MTDAEKLSDLVSHHQAQADHYYELSDAAQDFDDRGSLQLHQLAEDHDARARELELLS